MIKDNVQYLKSQNLRSFMSRSTIDEAEDGIVCYANLLIEKTTGKILELSSSLKVIEGAVSVPVALKKKSLWEGEMRVEPAYDKEQLPSAAGVILEKSLAEFNKSV